ncbi:unnamed protein product [Albugo candida]|uniref:HORMA domain-containing protein n=1 Tax=Albugo candida TaxID=65357 RepID=A0A024GPQ3_9STRA|nr:unnamed protein product [Albugo candida]|eukprot:CCI48503.1 unnamed protein product [Albugo candida]
MTRRATNTGPLTAPEELTIYMNALMRHDFDDEGCEEECDNLERVMMESSTTPSQENVITLKGSTELVAEFFHYGINRFRLVLYYGYNHLRVHIIASYINEVSIQQKPLSKKYNMVSIWSSPPMKSSITFYQHSCSNYLPIFEDWASKCQVQKVVLVITGVESKEVLERWVFDVQTPLHLERNHSDQQSSQRKVKARKAIVSEIQAVIRQITASVSFLPLLHEPSTFDLLVYTNKDSNVPALWEESDPRYVKNSAQVRLRSFDTNVHKIDAFVAYKNPDENNA